MASSKKIEFWEKVLPQAAKLPRTSGFFKQKSQFSAKSSVPGSEAARDKWLLKKKVDLLEEVLPQAAKLPRKSCLLKKTQKMRTALPQAAKLPGTSGVLTKKFDF